jgi:AcrR family transcriptional regulator
MMSEKNFQGEAMDTREAKKIALEKHIYSVAIHLFCEHGYSETTLIDIANTAEVSTRTLYKYFPTKEAVLRRFGRENLVSLKIYAESLPKNLDLKERILAVMIHDYKQMFCVFDIDYVLHPARNRHGELVDRFEIENVLITRSIYFNILTYEQLRCGIEPDDNTHKAASILLGIYRQESDLYRFEHLHSFNQAELRAHYEACLDIIWESLCLNLDLASNA